MKILIIEDNVYKRAKITSYLDTKYKDLIFYEEAASYASAIQKIEQDTYDCLILDMSMPTYDVSKTESGGRFRVFGGKEILKQLKRKGLLIKFILLTQYSTFSEPQNNKTLNEITQELKNLFPLHFIRSIFYDTTSSLWKDELDEELKKL